MQAKRAAELIYELVYQQYTEGRFIRVYDDLTTEGLYVCQKCHSPLFFAEYELISSLIGPNFDDILLGAFTYNFNDEENQTNTHCAKCGCQIGHVIHGEGFSLKEIQHIIDHKQLKFLHEGEYQFATFAAGCFWGVEYHLSQQNGVYSTQVGYTGGNAYHPNYKEVCKGITGHVEAVRILFNPLANNFLNLLKLFFEIHDFTQIGGQGPDLGCQYLSKIFAYTTQQKELSQMLIEQLISYGYDVSTEICAMDKFWVAEIHHQDYYIKTNKEPYCHSRKKIFELECNA